MTQKDMAPLRMRMVEDEAQVGVGNVDGGETRVVWQVARKQ
jgi:hypothetical protein